MSYYGRTVSTETNAKMNRIQSPSTYISTYNRLCNEEVEQSKACMQIDKKHSDLFLWKDAYVPLNKIVIPTLLENYKIKRKGTDSPQVNESEDETERLLQAQNQQPQMQLLESYKNLKFQREKQREKEMLERTKNLAKMIQENNTKSLQTRQSHRSISSNYDESDEENPKKNQIVQLDPNQRKYFSSTKQQMLELQNHMKTSQKISKEIMDRKNLSIKKVLSSIPQEKLMGIIESKQYYFKKILQERLQPKQEWRLKSKLSPKFTGENNYDYQNLSSRKSSNSPLQSTPKLYSTLRSKLISEINSGASSKRASQQQIFSQFQLEDPSLNELKYQKNKNFSPRYSSVQVNRTSKSQKRLTLENPDKIGLYYLDDMQSNFGAKQMADRESSQKKREMRVRSLHEVQGTIDRKNMQYESPKQNTIRKSIIQKPSQSLEKEQCLENVSFRPKTSLEKMLQFDDLEQKQLLIESLEQRSKESKYSNFFNYGCYFKGKYTSKNQGLQTKLSSNALQENEKFEQDLETMIKQIDLRHNK